MLKTKVNRTKLKVRLPYKRKPSLSMIVTSQVKICFGAASAFLVRVRVMVMVMVMVMVSVRVRFRVRGSVRVSVRVRVRVRVPKLA